ncbi:MAG TPA: aspartate aminotransferase family protein [Bacteroidia bacterium]|jgi:acetylornithine/succinyldiaminopimelate/putrescine aminotransferase|nr:aspartate aminotransferase family protein [Bacteroidia bacterium]
MSGTREQFFRHVAQTSELPLALEIERAEGSWIYTSDKKKYLDLISGISVSNTGHRHPHVLKAIQAQLDKYLHTMVYGEHIQAPQVRLATALCSVLPKSLDSVYFTNSGTEAVEGASKLAKRYTGRTELISFKNAYHGSTQGALSLMGDEFFKNAFRPLLPGVSHLIFNDEKELGRISNQTAAVFIEPVQGEAGVVRGRTEFLQKLRRKCSETGTLLVLDEIQTGFGRTGTLFAFEQYGIVPDILLCAKGMGGGMPLGAFIASKEIMQSLSRNPVLGHISTFGGHPVSCAAGLASLEVLQTEELIAQVERKGKLFTGNLKHKAIKEIRSAGLLLALDFGEEALNLKIISACMEKGVLSDWFLFNSHSMRIAPPLTITDEEIVLACKVIEEAIHECCQA